MSNFFSDLFDSLGQIDRYCHLSSEIMSKSFVTFYEKCAAVKITLQLLFFVTAKLITWLFYTFTWGIPLKIEVKCHHQKNFFLRFCSFLPWRYPLGRYSATPNFFLLGPIFWVLRGFKNWHLLGFLGVPTTFGWP